MKKSVPSTQPETVGDEAEGFAEISSLIAGAHEHTARAINVALIDLYWRIGQVISRRIAADGWGKGTV